MAETSTRKKGKITLSPPTSAPVLPSSFCQGPEYAGKAKYLLRLVKWLTARGIATAPHQQVIFTKGENKLINMICDKIIKSWPPFLEATHNVLLLVNGFAFYTTIFQSKLQEATNVDKNNHLHSTPSLTLETHMKVKSSFGLYCFILMI
jgi:hypothetical protein